MTTQKMKKRTLAHALWALIVLKHLCVRKSHNLTIPLLLPVTMSWELSDSAIPQTFCPCPTSRPAMVGHLTSYWKTPPLRSPLKE